MPGRNLIGKLHKTGIEDNDTAVQVTASSAAYCQRVMNRQDTLNRLIVVPNQMIIGFKKENE